MAWALGTHHFFCTGGEEAHSHWHVRVAGQFLPPEGTRLEIALDPRQAFVFPLAA